MGCIFINLLLTQNFLSVLVLVQWMDMKKFLLTEYQQDILKEIGNVGIGKGATALSKMLSKTVKINIPDISISNIDDLIDSDKELMVAISDVSGEIKGFLLGIFDKDSSLQIVEFLYSKEKGEQKEIDDSVKGAFTEILNVVGGNYLSALSDMLKISLLPMPPIFMSGNKISLLDSLKMKLGDNAMALKLKTKMIVEDTNMTGNIIFVSDNDNLRKILELTGN